MQQVLQPGAALLARPPPWGGEGDAVISLLHTLSTHTLTYGSDGVKQQQQQQQQDLGNVWPFGCSRRTCRKLAYGVKEEILIVGLQSTKWSWM